MALIICPECGRQVSDRAAACPQCGYPISTAPMAQENTNQGKSKDLMLARRAFEEKNLSEAGRYYSRAYESDPFDWEASFYKTLCQATAEMDVSLLTYCIPNVRKLIEGIQDESGKVAAYREMFIRSAAFSDAVTELVNNSERYSYLKEPMKDLGDALITDLPSYIPEEVKTIGEQPIRNYADMLIASSRRLLNSMRSGLF